MADGHGSENSRVVRAAGVVGMATMLSRIFGFIRDMIVAGFFGAGLTTDAFFVAFRIPNLLRRLLAEGSLTVSFVPVFMEYLKNRTREEAPTSPSRPCRSCWSPFRLRASCCRRSS
jgi:putative peptidoglycan lipid II flippase